MDSPEDKTEVAALSRRAVRWIAWALFASSFALLWVTQDMGFTRDESFYFGFGESYQGWFARAERAPDRAGRRVSLGRSETLKTWKGNFEHPPLMKVLFGWSWRAFARHDRRLVVPATTSKDPKLQVAGLLPADGFAEGERVTILGPLAQGGEASSSGRELGGATINKRASGRATLALDEGLTLDGLREICAKKKPNGAIARGGRADSSEVPIVGCQARDGGNLAIMSESAAMRLPGIVSGAAAVALTFLLGVALFNWVVGLFGALIFTFVPRTFFHAHLACFDMPIVAATLATLYAFWLARDDRRWALGAGLFWGLALMTKHNAFFLAVPLVVFWLWCGRHDFRWSRRGWVPSLKLPSIPLALLVMPLVAFPMLFVFWPRLWYDGYIGVAEYFQFHLEHVHYLQWYFGEPLGVPPFPMDFPWALTWYTVPEPFLLLFGVGLVTAFQPWRAMAWFAAVKARVPPTRHERAMAYAVLGGLVPIVLISLPSVPIFGGVKHWMTGMPLLSLVAGFGLFKALTFAFSRFPMTGVRLALASVILAGVFVGPVSATLSGNRYGTGYYNEIAAGGAQGAADRQMMRLYWGHTTRDALEWLNANAPLNARVFWQNTAHGSYEYYRRDGLLRHDIRMHGSPHGAHIALIEPQKSFANVDIDTRLAFKAAGPSLTVDYDGVPMLWIYVREPRKRAVKPVPRRQQSKTKPMRGNTQPRPPALPRTKALPVGPRVVPGVERAVPARGPRKER